MRLQERRRMVGAMGGLDRETASTAGEVSWQWVGRWWLGGICRAGAGEFCRFAAAGGPGQAWSACMQLPGVPGVQESQRQPAVEMRAALTRETKPIAGGGRGGSPLFLINLRGKRIGLAG